MRRSRKLSRWTVLGISLGFLPTYAETVIQIENFEFASSDPAAEAGVTDVTDWQNLPTFYISGSDENASEGLYSIGTDAMFGASGVFEPGTFIGFLREISTELFPTGQVDLRYTYGDPLVQGPVPPDRPLSDFKVIGDFYGDGGFASGPTGTHLWVNIIDAEGEKYNFINYSEVSLYSEIFTLDVVLGEGLIRIDPESVTQVPDGDRLLTEIVAFEVKLQDEDDPPDGVGKWYVDNLRIAEPDPALPGDGDGDGDVDLADFEAMLLCVTGPAGGPIDPPCRPFDFDADEDVDFADFAGFQGVFTGAL